MSEDKMREALGMEPEQKAAPKDPPEEVKAEPEDVEQEEVEAEPYTEDTWRESQIAKAGNNGWKPLQDWIDSGGDPDEWVSAEVFNVKGDFIGKLKAKDRDVERIVQDRVAGVKKLYDAKLDDLSNDRDKAIEMGDRDEVRRIEKQMTDLQEPVSKPQDAMKQALTQWNEENQWIFENTPKAAYAKQQFALHANSGKPIEDALALVERDVHSQFPTEKPRKAPPSTGERGKGPQGFKSKAKTVGMDDLSREERTLWANMPEAWGNDESKFLKAVADSRKAEEK